ncbi:DUF937 domain-containing protein [Burkholderia ubonensis]|uniref:DUF937 domain-containing protein n=1 Tax=Burkholderia ubonensis TaxID=101571 RepID=UPI00075C6671|nr:DUF937 domain-containing protein [Burkholderia ubonensis]KWK64570.1 hypothetical protein WM15_11400 [Burkholderia ubonensis]
MTHPDILRILHNLIATPITEQAPLFLGEAKRDVKDAVDLLLPNLLAAVVHRGLATLPGADALTAVLESPRLDRSPVPTNPDNFFSGGVVTETNMRTGSALLAELFGDRIPAMGHAVASMSHLKLESGHALLAMIAPFMFAVLRRAWVAGSDGASRASLIGLLRAQRPAISPKLQDRYLLALGIPSAAAWLESTLEPQAVMTQPATAAPAPGVDKGRHRHRAWWAILLLLFVLAALLALAYCTHRLPGATDKNAAATAPVVVVQPASLPEPASSAPASAASAAGAASEPASSPAVASKPSPATAAPLLEVRFGYASAALPADFAQAAAEWIAYAKDHADATFEVFGFADNIGAPALNERLANRRAEAVMAALVAAGAGTTQLSKGVSQVVSDTADAAAARRAEVRPKP